MVAVVFSRASFAFEGRAALLSEVDLRLGRGFHGLVGANGAGKSTLLALVAGGIAPTSGAVRVEPAGARVALCEQSVSDRPSDAVAAFARDEGGIARGLRGRLALADDDLARWSTLSPGERKRWQVGAVLADEPDVLLLDEPTNHLDAAGRRLLVDALESFDGVAIVVSHDRALLDELTTSTVRVHAGRVTAFAGAYADARAAWELAARARADARAELVHGADRARAHLVASRDDRAAAQRERSSSRRMKSAHDTDGRSDANKFRVGRAEARLGRRAGVARAAAERAEVSVPAFEVDPTLGRSVFVGYEPPPRRELLSLRGAVRAPGGGPALFDASLVVSRGERVRVEGQNGAGKTSLLEALLAGSTLPRERVLYVPQHLDAAAARAEVAAVRALQRDARRRVLSLVAALGVDPDRLLATPSPSPGEAKKLFVARGLAGHAWLAVLDEPENHLDLPSIERLEAALRAFPGALVVVSHDPRFLAGAFDATWTLRGGGVDLA